jgi:hypothetical protein
MNQPAVADFVRDLPRPPGVAYQPTTLDALAVAISRLSDAEVEPDAGLAGLAGAVRTFRSARFCSNLGAQLLVFAQPSRVSATASGRRVGTIRTRSDL